MIKKTAAFCQLTYGFWRQIHQKVLWFLSQHTWDVWESLSIQLICLYHLSLNLYSNLPNNSSPTVINFWNFFQGLLSYLEGYVYYFCQLFLTLFIWKFLKVRFMDFQYIESLMWKFLLKKRIKLVNNVLFLENIEGYVFRIFHGLLLFEGLLLSVFDKIPGAMLIWGGYYYSADKST